MSRPGRLTVVGGASRTYPLTKRAPLRPDDPEMKRGFTTVEVGKERCTFEVLVDVAALVAAVGGRARGRKGVTKLQGGAVVVRLVSRENVGPEWPLPGDAP